VAVAASAALLAAQQNRTAHERGNTVSRAFPAALTSFKNIFFSPSKQEL
jgi:hypothetical protein